MRRKKGQRKLPMAFTILALGEGDAAAWLGVSGAASAQHFQVITLCWVALTPLYQESIA